MDECHRTQTGKLHKTMKALLSGAVYIGFTATPLLRQDTQTSLEVFGGYIHTYKFGEGVPKESGTDHDFLHKTAVGLGAGVPCNMPSILMSSSTSGQWTQMRSPINFQWSR